jgi:hypothetical protein
MRARAVASVGAGVVAGAVALVLLRVGRAPGEQELALTLALAAGLASGAFASTRYARRWGSHGLARAAAALALLLALGRPFWAHVPAALAALGPSLPTRPERVVAGLLVMLPLAALPAHWLSLGAGAGLAHVPRGAARARSALLAAVALPAGGLLAWLAVSALDARRALGMTALATAALALALDRGRSIAPRLYALATTLVVVAA